MFTRCPSCQTLFRIRAEILSVAHGEVRCGRCGVQFNALDSLAEDPEALAAQLNGAVHPESVSEAQEAATEEVKQTASDQDVPAEAEGDRPETVVDEHDELDEPEALAASRVEVPRDETYTAEKQEESEMESDAVPTRSSAEPGADDAKQIGLSPEAIQATLLHDEPAPAPWGPRIAGAAAILALLAALGVQWVYMQRVPLYAQPQWRPALQRLCALLACDLPLPRQPEQVEVLERVVREHPRVSQALLVELTFVSRAREPIAYPIIELRLADVSGNRVMGRQFTPADYLPATLDRHSGLVPGKPLHITLELVAPATDVVSFQFDFL